MTKKSTFPDRKINNVHPKNDKFNLDHLPMDGYAINYEGREKAGAADMTRFGLPGKPNKPLLLSVFISFMLLLFISISAAGTDQRLSKGKAERPTGKCWQRQKAFEDTGNSPLCRDFEKLLNTTCEPPDTLKCNWTIPPEEKKFKKLQWETIDPKAHWNLIRDMVLSGWGEKYRVGQWERLEPEYKLALEKGLLEMKVTQTDIDHDGAKDQIVLIQKGHCGKPGEHRIFGVIDQNDGNLDNKFRYVVLGLGASHGDVISYDNQTFMFGWDAGINRVMVWEGFDAQVGKDSKGSKNVCQFKYLQGGS